MRSFRHIALAAAVTAAAPTTATTLATTVPTTVPTTDAHARLEVPAAALRAGTLSFVGHSTAGDFSGTTTSVTGAVVGGDDLATTGGWAEAPVETLRTGNGLRDRHMREALDAGRYRTIRFDVKSVRTAATAQADSASATLVGALTIHGVARDVEVPATLVRRANTVRVTSTFPLRLRDYRIDPPRAALGMLRVRDDIEVHADLQFVIAAPVRG